MKRLPFLANSQSSPRELESGSEAPSPSISQTNPAIESIFQMATSEAIPAAPGENDFIDRLSSIASQSSECISRAFLFKDKVQAGNGYYWNGLYAQAHTSCTDTYRWHWVILLYFKKILSYNTSLILL